MQGATVVKILRTGNEGVLDSIGKDVFDDPIDARAAASFLTRSAAPPCRRDRILKMKKTGVNG